MRTNFIESVLENNKIFIFRFVKIRREDKYLIFVLSNSTVEPFTIYLNNKNKWVTEAGDRPEIIQFEKPLNEILSQHHLSAGLRNKINS